MHPLFVTMDGGGNLPPALLLAREITRRGGTARFFGHATSAPPSSARLRLLAIRHGPRVRLGRAPLHRLRAVADDNETGFRIERCSASSCTNFSQIAEVGTGVASYSSTGLEAGMSYSYRVRAYNDVGDSAYSTTATAVTQAAATLPAAPSSLTATAKAKNRIELTWRDNSTNESGFRIERCTGSSCTNFSQIAEVGQNTTAYINTGLRANTTYRYRVLAWNSGGTSDYSNIASATTPRR